MNCCNSRKKAVRMGRNYKVTGNTYFCCFSGNEYGAQSHEFCKSLCKGDADQDSGLDLLVCAMPVCKNQICIFPLGDYFVLNYMKKLEPTTALGNAAVVITCLVITRLVAGIGCVDIYPCV